MYWVQANMWTNPQLHQAWFASMGLRDKPAKLAAKLTPASKVSQLHPCSGNEVIWESRDMVARSKRLIPKWLHTNASVQPNIHVFSMLNWFPRWIFWIVFNQAPWKLEQSMMSIWLMQLVFPFSADSRLMSIASWIKPRWSHRNPSESITHPTQTSCAGVAFFYIFLLEDHIFSKKSNGPKKTWKLLIFFAPFLRKNYTSRTQSERNWT